ncbi:MAG: hypothetical protein D6744_01585 [Planctomycetota bacterium]|nr:MAG: hypothetical protein D6744_01585 [Planctomycetota bacterium]
MRGRNAASRGLWCKLPARRSPVVNVPRFIRRLFRAPYDGLRNLRAVEEGVLYRCGQPAPGDLRNLIEQLKLRTVIALRGSRDASDPDEWERAEKAVCDEHGVRFVSLPCNHKNPPTPEQVARFLDLVTDPERTPALVHCRIGQQRTGMFCALYRVHVQGVDPDEALREMDEFGFDSRNRRHRRLLDKYREYAARRPVAAS